MITPEPSPAPRFDWNVIDTTLGSTAAAACDRGSSGALSWLPLAGEAERLVVAVPASLSSRFKASSAPPAADAATRPAAARTATARRPRREGDGGADEPTGAGPAGGGVGGMGGAPRPAAPCVSNGSDGTDRSEGSGVLAPGTGGCGSVEGSSGTDACGAVMSCGARHVRSGRRGNRVPGRLGGFRVEGSRELADPEASAASEEDSGSGAAAAGSPTVVDVGVEDCPPAAVGVVWSSVMETACPPNLRTPWVTSEKFLRTRALTQAASRAYPGGSQVGTAILRSDEP